MEICELHHHHQVVLKIHLVLIETQGCCIYLRVSENSAHYILSKNWVYCIVPYLLLITGEREA